MARVLVTGGTGFVGRPAVMRLVDAGHETHVASRQVARAPHGATSHAVDMLDTGAAERLLALVEPVRLLHLAWADPADTRSSGVNARYATAGRALLAAFAELGGKRAVAIGCCAEYDWRQGVCREDGPLRPRSSCAGAKDELRRALGDIAVELDLSACWARLFFPYGPGDHASSLAGSAAKELAAGRPVQAPAPGVRRDRLYVDDAAEALVALLDTPAEGPVNVGSGEAIEERELVWELARAAGREELVREGSLRRRRGEPPLVEADIARLRAATGWSPRVPLEQGAARTMRSQLT